MTSSIVKLFNLFQLDGYLQSKEEIEGIILERLAGGVTEIINIGEEYRNSSLNFPERMWRILGKDFNLDVYDLGNGYYQLVKVRIKRE